jgi:3-phytase
MKRNIFASLLFVPLISLLLFSCNSQPSRSEHGTPIWDSVELENLEAREDSLELVRALGEQSLFETRVIADLETEPVQSDEGEDAADDPAIWYNPADPAESLVLGTDKNAGVYVYDLEGKVIQFRDVGRINNIDLRGGFMFRGEEVVLVAGSNRSNNAITLFYIDPDTGILSDTISNIPSTVDEVYGICLYHNRPDNEFHVFVNGKGGKLEQWLITAEGESMQGKLLRTIMLSSQPEGMVADDRYGTVYLGVEMEGIYKLAADPAGDPSPAKIPGSDADNPNITYDIEGLAIFSLEGTDYLIASSQGNFSYAIFRLGKEEEYLTSFIITEGAVDGVEETDGLEVVARPFNSRFKHGLLVVQDGFNTDGEVAKSQNFKFVSFSQVEAVLRANSGGGE